MENEKTLVINKMMEDLVEGLRAAEPAWYKPGTAVSATEEVVHWKMPKPVEVYLEALLQNPKDVTAMTLLLLIRNRREFLEYMTKDKICYQAMPVFLGMELSDISDKESEREAIVFGTGKKEPSRIVVWWESVELFQEKI